MDDRGPIVSLQEYRDQKPGKGPCWITFIGFPFDDRGHLKTLRLTVETVESEIEGVIRVAQERGGVYFEESPIATWFLPWPCAAVYIRHEKPKTAGKQTRGRS